MLKDYHFIDVWYRFYVKKGEEQADEQTPKVLLAIKGLESVSFIFL
jgi:hypothetical protein